MLGVSFIRDFMDDNPDKRIFIHCKGARRVICTVKTSGEGLTGHKLMSFLIRPFVSSGVSTCVMWPFGRRKVSLSHNYSPQECGAPRRCTSVSFLSGLDSVSLDLTLLSMFA
jgi:hypothetical protein